MDRATDLGTIECDRDDELVAQARGGSQAAFDALFGRHKEFVHNVCYRMIGNTDDAVDAAQTAFIRAYRHLSEFRGESGFRTWLYRIAINVCSEQIRREQRRRLIALRFTPPVESEASGDRVWEAMLRLPPDLRAVLVLFYFEELSCQEVAEALDCSEGAVRTRLHRARIAFKEKYTRVDS